MNVLLLVLFALLSAVGNALYVAAQKKVGESGNSLAFVVYAGAICLVLTLLAAPLMGRTAYVEMARERWPWLLLGGAGLFCVYVGFNLLFGRYGAASYAVYAVLSLALTTVVVGAWMFHERLNVYHWMAVGAAILTVVLYAAGQWRAQL